MRCFVFTAILPQVLGSWLSKTRLIVHVRPFVFNPSGNLEVSRIYEGFKDLRIRFTVVVL